MAFEVTVKDLMEAGVHFGHQTKRWNPKMRPFIYTQRDGVHIIDLSQTIDQTKKAYKFVADTVALGENILFVGTKKQAKDVISEHALRAGQFFVSNRWLGGMLTNFKTIRASIDRLNTLEAKREKGDFEKLTKKEGLKLEHEIEKLESSLGGIKKMTRLPGAIFVVDPSEEDIACKEANKLSIPIIALVDTNCNPDGIDYVIAANDDALRSIQLFSKVVADACVEGSERREIALRETAAARHADKEAGEKGKAAPREQERKIGGKGRAWVAKHTENEVSGEEAAKFASAKAKTDKEDTDK